MSSKIEMSTSVEQLVGQISKNPELQQQFQKAGSVDEVITIAKGLGYDLEASDVMAYQQQNITTLSDDDLEKVAGGSGGCYADAKTKATTVYPTKDCYD